MIRGVANLLPVRRESIIVLSAQREHRSIVITRREIVEKKPIGIVPAFGVLQRAPRLFEIRGWHYKNVAALAFLVSIPMAIEQMVKHQSLHLRLLNLITFSQIAVVLPDEHFVVALGINIRGEQDALAVGRPEFAICLRGDTSQLMHSCNCAGSSVETSDPDLRPAIFIRDKSKPLPIRRPARTVPILI